MHKIFSDLMVHFDQTFQILSFRYHGVHVISKKLLKFIKNYQHFIKIIKRKIIRFTKKRRK